MSKHKSIENALNASKVDVEFGTGTGDLSQKVKKQTPAPAKMTESQQTKREKDMKFQQ